MVGPAADSEEVVILAPTGRDAPLVCQVLEVHGIRCRVLHDPAELVAAVTGAGAAIVADEAVTPALLAQLAPALEAQPSWSDFPWVVLSTRRISRAQRQVLSRLGNVTMLERPVHAATLQAALEAALRGRRRQYASREEIARREQFLAMLGHELRNPLAAILSASELLSRRPPPESIARHVGIVRHQASHLAHLVDDLLEVSRVTSGKISLHRQILELADIIDGILRGLDERLREGRYRLTFNRTLGLQVNGDPVRLEQVFSNLLTNAIKYTPAGGAIAIRLGREVDQAVVSIRDDGIGIEPAMLPRIFDLFTQVDATIDRAAGGMGIGLTLVKRMVELHGGAVEAQSQGRGRGSEFVVRLPLAVEASAPAPQVEVAESRSQGNGLSLVLVEDSADLSETLAELLREQGHEVQIASDGQAGADLIVEVQPDCAIVDIGLPVLDGYEVAAKVRAALGAGVRLLALTGYGQPEDGRRAISAGFDVHLKKPIDFEALTHALAQVPRQP